MCVCVHAYMSWIFGQKPGGNEEGVLGSGSCCCSKTDSHEWQRDEDLLQQWIRKAMQGTGWSTLVG